jgi:OOP family OmpA-OmpF porin
MPIGRPFLLPIAFVSAAALSLAAATVAVGAIEARSALAVRTALALAGLDWVEVSADGLQLHLAGMAETEAQRFRALSVAGSVVDSARVIDAMEVRPAEQMRAPAFSIEALRNDDGVQLIGLVPASEDRAALRAHMAELAPGTEVADMLEAADFPAPAGWDRAVAFGWEALRRLPRSKVSIAPERVKVTGITGSATEKARIERELSRLAPPGLHVVLALSAPRPVITPFTLRFLIDGEGARFDACSADTEAARRRILAAAEAAGARVAPEECTLGLGVPSPRWADAAAAGIAALAELGEGTLTFSDADVSLVAAHTVPQAEFDRVVGELDRALPDTFALTAVRTRPPAADTAEGPPEFTAVLTPEGEVQLRGRLTDPAVREVVESYAAARFGAGKVYAATRLDADLPEGWPVRVLAALEALARLAHGQAVVRPDTLRVRGTAGDRGAQAAIAQLLAAKLGDGANFEIQVAYEARLDPLAALPTPEECVAAIAAIQAERKITFAPGSAEIAPEAHPILDRIAAELRRCSDVPIEIAAHSDSQGREEMNLELSQARAESVLAALMGRRVPTANLTAVGYGESRPIADNATEAGREANRRIEFVLATPPGAHAAAADGGGAAEEAAAGGGEAE